MEYKKGQTVWFFFNGNICEALMHDQIAGNDEYILVRLVTMNHQNTEGILCWKRNELFATKQECKQKLLAYNEATENNYVDSIRCVEDLVAFTCKHRMNGPECDVIARRAAIRAARKLNLALNFDIETC